jgi:hypothetical protein
MYATFAASIPMAQHPLLLRGDPRHGTAAIGCPMAAQTYGSGHRGIFSKVQEDETGNQ